MRKMLEISAFYHDAAAALTIDGRIVAAAQEERFTRVKHTPDFPLHAIRYCQEEGGLEIDELDAVVFYDKFLLKLDYDWFHMTPAGVQKVGEAIFKQIQINL